MSIPGSYSDLLQGGGGGGAAWFNGVGVPSPALGQDGDYYLDNLTSNVYEKSGGVWSVVANIRGDIGRVPYPVEAVFNAGLF